jgi:hypothetical protein
MTKIATVNSLEARVMADYASGMRGEPDVLLTGMDPDGEHFRVRPDRKHGPCSNAKDVATPVYTPFVQPARAPVVGVGIQAEGMSGMESLMQYDAVFWSEAAVEKFLFPYYASKYQWHAAHALEKLTKIWYGYIPRPGAGPENAMLDANMEIPFAVGHLPRSDYVELMDELVVISHDAAGTVRHRPLSKIK